LAAVRRNLTHGAELLAAVGTALVAVRLGVRLDDGQRILPQALADIRLGEFVDEFVDRREFVNRRDVLSLIFGAD